MMMTQKSMTMIAAPGDSDSVSVMNTKNNLLYPLEKLLK